VKYLCLGCAGPDGLISTIALYRDWPVGAFAFESVEMTLLDLRLDYPKPKVLAKMPLKKELVSQSARRLEKAARQLLS
jgi:ribosomal protein L10